MADQCNIQDYGYVPTEAAGITFATIFGLLTLYSLYTTARRHLWYIAMLCAGILETLGWCARAVQSNGACDKNLFIMQICCLIVAPAFMSAALYILLGLLISRDPCSSLWQPRTYLVVFCTVDFLSLLLQAVGGGIASGATTDKQSLLGSNVISGGVFVQLAGMGLFVLLGLLFLRRTYAAGKSVDGRVLVVLAAPTVLVFLRNIYRAVELLGGWNGRINTTEIYLLTMDGVPMVVALGVLCYLMVIDAELGQLLDMKLAKAAVRDWKQGRNDSEESIPRKVEA